MEEREREGNRSWFPFYFYKCKNTGTKFSVHVSCQTIRNTDFIFDSKLFSLSHSFNICAMWIENGSKSHSCSYTIYPSSRINGIKTMLHRHHITEMLNAISNAICVSARARARFGKDGFYVSAHSKPNDLLEYKVLHISQSKVLCVLKQLMLYSHSCATSSKDALSFVDSLSCYCLGQGDLCYRQTLATHSTYYA